MTHGWELVHLGAPQPKLSHICKYFDFLWPSNHANTDLQTRFASTQLKLACVDFRSIYKRKSNINTMSGEKDPFRFTKSIILDPENYDEIETVDMEASQDGSSQFEESSILGLLKHHPKERRKRSERVALYSLIGFLALMTFVMMRLKRSKYQETLVASGEKAGSILEINEAMNATKIYCSGRLSYSMHEWLSEDVSNSANLCDPEVRLRIVGKNVMSFTNLIYFRFTTSSYFVFCLIDSFNRNDKRRT